MTKATGKPGAIEPNPFEKPKGTQSTAPNVPASFLLVQFWRDIFGKEVQSAATYSYLWMADQMGHVALGLILQFILAALCQHVLMLSEILSNWLGFLGISGVVAFWEFRAYSVSAKAASDGIFPLDKMLLRDNAVIAAAYMVFGALAGFAFHLPILWAVVATLIAVAASIFCAPKWLRQKIVWQKAALPYLSRLADLRADVPPAQAKAIQDLIAATPGQKGPWRQIIIAGAVGSGRTPMVTGLGTDLAFKGYKVRYLSFDDLMEVDDQFLPGRPLPPIGSWGPLNVFYWPWFEAEVLLIDNVSPAVGAGMKHGSAAELGSALNQSLALIRNDLCNRHTVWVFGLDEPLDEVASQKRVDDYAQNIRAFCKGEQEPIVVRLPAPDWMQQAAGAPGSGAGGAAPTV